MHTEKIKIFDEYAKSQGYADWEDLMLTYDLDLMTSDEFDCHIFEACDLVQKEQQKRIAENEREYFIYDGINNEFEKYDSILKAKEHITEMCVDEDEGIHPDIESVLILKTASEVKVIEDGEFYKVKFEECILSENNLIK